MSLGGALSDIRWRTGRTVGRTIYRQTGPSDDDELIGVMDTVELAREVVEAVNRQRAGSL